MFEQFCAVKELKQEFIVRVYIAFSKNVGELLGEIDPLGPILLVFLKRFFSTSLGTLAEVF